MFLRWHSPSLFLCACASAPQAYWEHSCRLIPCNGSSFKSVELCLGSGLACFAFRLAFSLLLVWRSWCLRRLGIRRLPFRLGVFLSRRWFGTTGLRRLLSARSGTSLKIMGLRATRGHLPLVRGCEYWQSSPFLHPSGLRKDLHTGLSVLVVGPGLDLVVGTAGLAERGCWARSTWRPTWNSRARALAKTTNFRQASWRFAMVTSSRSPLSRKIATHSDMKMLSDDWRGFSNVGKDRHRSSGFNIICADTSSATTSLVIQSSSQDANWYILVGSFAGSA